MYKSDSKSSTDKHPIFVFLLLVSIFAAIGYILAITMGDDNRTGGLVIVQFAPLVAAFITKLIFQRNLRGLGWGWGKARYQALAYGLAFVIPLISFSFVWVLGFGGFYNMEFITETQAGLANTFGINFGSDRIVILALLVLNATVGMFVAFGGIGEELGWRGFLVPELYKHYNFTKTSLISGVIWAIYHWPLLILLMAPRLDIAPWPLMIFSLIGGIGLSTIMAWLRLRSGSVWTAVIFHMALNVQTQGTFQNLTTETSRLTHYISGEHGLMLALIAAAFGMWFWSKRKQILHV